MQGKISVDSGAKICDSGAGNECFRLQKNLQIKINDTITITGVFGSGFAVLRSAAGQNVYNETEG